VLGRKVGWEEVNWLCLARGSVLETRRGKKKEFGRKTMKEPKKK